MDTTHTSDEQVLSLVDTSLLDYLHEGVYIVDRHRKILYWNAAATTITGYLPEEVIGRSCKDNILRHVTDQGVELCTHGCPLQQVMRTGERGQAHVFLHHKDGPRLKVEVRGLAIKDLSGKIVGSLEFFYTPAPNAFLTTADTTPLSIQDPVTGLATRVYGMRVLDDAFKAASAGEDMSLVFVDVDSFKTINDKYGHVVGDQVLRMVGQTIASAVNMTDVPIRWGGDEFVVVLASRSSQHAQRLVRSIVSLVSSTWLDVEGAQVKVTVSAGLADWSGSPSVGDWLAEADGRMYEAKRSGKNTAVF